MPDNKMTPEGNRQIPDGPDLEKQAEEIAVLAAIERGRRDADQGRVVRHEEVKKRVSSWISS